MNNNELSHHGIKDQRWGVRRFQNPDGSLTAEGKIRYRKGDKPKTETIEEKKERILKSRSAKALYENADLFDYKELNDAYSRLTLEKNIKSLAPAEISKGEAFVNNVIKWGNKVSNLAKVAADTYSNVNRIMKIVNGGTDPEEGKKDKQKDKKKGG